MCTSDQLELYMHQAKSSDYLLTEKEAAEYLNLAAHTLCMWRCTQRIAVPHIRMGRSVRYRKADLEKWLESQTVCAAA